MRLFGDDEALLRISNSRNAIELFPIQLDTLGNDLGLMTVYRQHHADRVLELGWLGINGWRLNPIHYRPELGLSPAIDLLSRWLRMNPALAMSACEATEATSAFTNVDISES